MEMSDIRIVDGELVDVVEGVCKRCCFYGKDGRCNNREPCSYSDNLMFKHHDVSQYITKDIEYPSSCSPVVEYFLRQGKMVQTIEGLFRPGPHSFRLKKKTVKLVKSRKQLYKILAEDGYECTDKGHWYPSRMLGGDAWLKFYFSMFDYCDKEPSADDKWSNRWLIDKPIGE